MTTSSMPKAIATHVVQLEPLATTDLICSYAFVGQLHFSLAGIIAAAKELTGARG